MIAGIGYSENPDTREAGVQVATDALAWENGRACDMVMLFATAKHDARVLREAVLSVVGDVPIVGGPAIGAISNTHFGYAGDQVIMAAIWTGDHVRCEIINEDGLADDEEETGIRLGEKLSAAGVDCDSHVLLFYNSIKNDSDGIRMLMATPLLKGIKEGLGYLPNLAGVGMQGDYTLTPMCMFSGKDTAEYQAAVTVFSGDIRMDTAVMHGCWPSTGYYTVTKADRQTILEINNEPAVSFLEKIFNHMVKAEEFPFFLILGINQGDKWGEFDAKNYASRLCLAIDHERGGIVMFEPDMVEGTEFQIMNRSTDLSYMPSLIEDLFNSLGNYKPVFAFYIDCAGRAAGYGGIDMEDALIIQKATAGRVPLLGIYGGVEIASVGAEPRGLDWSGVFCLFSVPNE